MLSQLGASALEDLAFVTEFVCCSSGEIIDDDAVLRGQQICCCCCHIDEMCARTGYMHPYASIILRRLLFVLSLLFVLPWRCCCWWC